MHFGHNLCHQERRAGYRRTGSDASCLFLLSEQTHPGVARALATCWFCVQGKVRRVTALAAIGASRHLPEQLCDLANRVSCRMIEDRAEEDEGEDEDDEQPKRRDLLVSSAPFPGPGLACVHCCWPCSCICLLWFTPEVLLSSLFFIFRRPCLLHPSSCTLLPSPSVLPLSPFLILPPSLPSFLPSSSSLFATDDGFQHRESSPLYA